nr:hypothetical protein 1634Bnrm1_p067 [Cryptomonas sp.]
MNNIPVTNKKIFKFSFKLFTLKSNNFDEGSLLIQFCTKNLIFSKTSTSLIKICRYKDSEKSSKYIISISNQFFIEITIDFAYPEFCTKKIQLVRKNSDERGFCSFGIKLIYNKLKLVKFR